MKKSILAAAMCFSVCLTACANESKSVDTDVLSAENSAAAVEQIQTDMSVSNGEADVFSNRGLVPGDFTDLDSEFARKYIINLPNEAELSNVSINNVDVDIQNITLGSMLEATGLTQCTYASTDLQFADYVFTSGMYGILADKTDIFSFGSLMSIETVDDDGNLVHGDSNIDSNLCAVKGLYTSNFFMQDDFDVIFFGGIKCGMPIKDAYASLGGEGVIFGEAIDHSTVHYFCNGHQVMIVKPEDDVIYEIMLLNL